MIIDYALKDFDNKHCWSIATIVANWNEKHQTLTHCTDGNWLCPEEPKDFDDKHCKSIATIEGFSRACQTMNVHHKPCGATEWH